MTTGSPQDPPPCGDENEVQEPEQGHRRPELPDDSMVVSEETITSPKGRRYRILRTLETDPYDDPPVDRESRS
jgi:hypothetical protein